MTKDIRIAPSLLSADFTRLGEEVAALTAAGADWLHVDVMDGRFVPNISIGLPVVEALHQITALPLDVHLMIVEPERYVDAFVAAGAAYVTVHVEASVHLHRTLQQIRQAGAKAGVTLNPHTPVEALQHVLHDVDLVLIMSVNPGFGGQGYIPEATHKIRTLAALRAQKGADFLIQVDGGVKVDNVHIPAAAGADVLVSGSGVFGGGDYGAAIAGLRSRAREACAPVRASEP